MAVHKGSEGTVKVGSNTVAEITGFSFDETADTIETTENQIGRWLAQNISLETTHILVPSSKPSCMEA